MTVAHYEEIANVLTREILTGQYRPGERMPSERDLAARFDMSRGAVREAIKKLDALGIAVVQPGGVRVAPVEEASLDVIGHMLSLDEVPSSELTEQIMQVIGALVILAAEMTVQRASEEEMARVRALVARLAASAERGQGDAVAQLEFMSTLMEISGNLVVKLIARALVMQFKQRMNGITAGRAIGDTSAYVVELGKLDEALANRDRHKLRAAMEALGEQNRRTITDALQQARSAAPTRKAADL